MKIQRLKFVILPLFLYMMACTDVLDMAPDGNMQMDEVLADPDRVEGLLNACYKNIPTKGYKYFFWEQAVVAATDDAWTSESGDNVITTGLYEDNNSAARHFLRDGDEFEGGGNTGYWERSWQQIRLCSQFIEVINQAAVHNENNRGRFKAEARVLRAFFYMELIKWFGKVPILDETMPYSTDFSVLSRSSVYDVAKFIVSDCDAAIQEPNLPWRLDNPNDGMRVTKALAYALKAKAMLFAASPLHNEGENHWREAYTIAKEAVEQLKLNGYSLFTQTTEPAVFGTGSGASFRQLVCRNADYSTTPRDRETIFQVRSGGAFVWHIGYIGSHMTGTYKCGAGPTQELVDAFETINGKPVLNLNKPYLDEKHLQPNYNTANTMYDPQNPYANRDPRFYETVLHNGSEILYNNVVVKIEAFTGGKHALSFDVTNRMASRTGYYPSKMVTPGAGSLNQINNSNWKYYRLGETLLDLAEAAAEAGYLDEALLAMNEVRARVDMPAIDPGISQADLILRVRNERRVELAWEEQRYFDVRRWQKPNGDLGDTNKWLTAMVITKNADNSFTYTRSNISDKPRGGWQNRDLLLPIPLSEASLLESVTGQKWQNPGW